LNKVKDITVVTPVHNEGASIFQTVSEFFDFYKESVIKLNFIISEDGSTDNTHIELKKLQEKYAVNIISEKERKGYSVAVIDGFKKIKTDTVCFIDSDGQCDPSDLEKLLTNFNGDNIVVGYRQPRQDSLTRKIYSNIFKILYKLVTQNRLKDPSCPYFITSKTNIDKIINTENIGILTQGFWWEFYARAQYLGIDFIEVKINHRKRASGSSVIFKFSNIPILAVKNILSFFELSKILKKIEK